VGVSSRRFDTDAVLQHIMEGDKNAFGAFYERYRGRIYRFIVRQYGTGDFGKAAYYSAWRNLVISSRNSQSPKDLKFAFFKYLGKSGQANLQTKHSEGQSSYLPKDLEEEGKWSLMLIEQFRRLPDPMKKRFLFKYEIGLSDNAIARILEDKRKHIEKSIEEAERILRLHMDEAGCPETNALDKLYRGSRVVKPPASWDGEILDSFAIWLKQAENPAAARMLSHQGLRDDEAGFGEMLTDWLDSLKHKLTGKVKKSRLSTSRH
jgi:DNA-directed RNA polymerase specialized sigma24 family protein